MAALSSAATVAAAEQDAPVIANVVVVGNVVELCAHREILADRAVDRERGQLAARRLEARDTDALIEAGGAMRKAH